MPLTKLVFKPGVNREMTSYSNEGSWFQTDKVRFRYGFPEKIGGWVKDTGPLSPTTPDGTFVSNGTTTPLSPVGGTFWGECKSMSNWLNLSGYNLLGLGTNLKFYIQNGTGGPFYDVTPIRFNATVASNAFTTVNGSNIVTCNVTANSSQPGDFVIISGVASAVNGIPAADLNGEFRIVATTSANTFTIKVKDPATSSGTTGAATFNFQLNTGSPIYATAVGWGAGTWGGVSGLLASTVLNGALTSGATTITVTSTTNFASAGTIQIDAEVITYTGVTPTTFTGCTRGVSGTTAAAHSNGATVAQYAITTGWGLPAAVTPGSGVPVFMRLWSQSNFGENLIICPLGGQMSFWAVNNNPNVFDRAQPIVAGVAIQQKNYTSGGYTFITPDATCPSQVNQVLVSDATRFTIAFGANDPTGTVGPTSIDPLLVRWSDQESYSIWTPAVTNQAGSYRLSQGSQIISAIQTRQEILVFTDLALYSMQFIGAPYVWSFQPMGSNISVISPNAVATANNLTFWMGTDKFYVYSGKVDTLPCTFRRDIFDNLNYAQSYQIFAGTNEGFNEVWWMYPSAGSNYPDSYVIYNYVENIWYNGTIARSSWLGTRLRTFPMATTYDPVNLSGNLVYHEDGVDDNSTGIPVPINSYIKSADFDIGDGDHFAYVWRIVPDVTFDGSTAAAPVVNMTMLPRQNPGATYGNTDNPSVTSGNNYTGQRTFPVQQFTQYAYVRVRGRQMSLEISSNTLGVQWQLGAPRLDTRPDGRR